jgi:glycine betaine/choline ABC-type transport system substrate-binding protein
MITTHLGRRISAALLILGSLGISACGSSGSAPTTDATVETVVVVGFDNDQSRVLTEVYAQALEKAGIRVGRKDPVADLAEGYAAINSGQADILITYTGDLLAQVIAAEPAAAAATTTAAPASSVTTIASTSTVAAATTTTAPPEPAAPVVTVAGATTTTVGPPVSSGQSTADRVTAQINAIGEILPSTMLFGAPALAQDKPSIVCSNSVATANSLATMSDLAAAANLVTLGSTADFAASTSFGLAGFTKLYGATFSKVVQLDETKVADAIAKGDVGCGVMRSTDHNITSDMSQLEDNLGLAADQAVLPLISSAASTPDITQRLDAVSSALGTADIRVMMHAIIVSKGAPNIVAGNWLRSVGVSTP